jgi:hypothetical protein
MWGLASFISCLVGPISLTLLATTSSPNQNPASPLPVPPEPVPAVIESSPGLVEIMPHSRQKEADDENSSTEDLCDPSIVEDGLIFPRPRGLHKRSRSRNFLGRVKPSSPSRTNNKKPRTKPDVPRKSGYFGITTRSHAKDVSIEIRPMNMADIADIYHLGNSIFTASDFPNLFRTWDDYTVVQNFESAPEFCFVAEATRPAEDESEDDSASSAKSKASQKPVDKSDSTEVIAFLLGDSLTKRTCGTRGYIQV